MVFINDSLTIVLLGDWNKLYIQPDWIAENVYKKNEIEIGVNGQGSDFTVSYKSDNVIVTPEQNKVIFSVGNTNKETISYLCTCINNYVEKAFSPVNMTYGLNCDFIEEKDVIFADVLDSMSDTNAIIECGYEIESTKISRTLKNEDKIMNMDSNLDNSILNVHFNEHHAEVEEKPIFNFEIVKEFINECERIVRELGYDLEGDE